MSEQRELVFFSDRDLGRAFPATLIAAGIRVERHDAHFAPDTADEEWIAEIGRRGYVNSLNGLKTLSPGRLKSRSFPVAIVRPWRRAVAAM